MKRLVGYDITPHNKILNHVESLGNGPQSFEMSPSGRPIYEDNRGRTYTQIPTSDGLSSVPFIPGSPAGLGGAGGFVPAGKSTPAGDGGIKAGMGKFASSTNPREQIDWLSAAAMRGIVELRRGAPESPLVKIPDTIGGLPVTPNANGSMSIGKSISIVGDKEYQFKVLQQMEKIGNTTTGAGLLQNLEAAGKNVTIQDFPQIPQLQAQRPNAFAIPTNPGDATAAGKTVLGNNGPIMDPNTGQPMVGTGNGSDAVILYNPDDWPLPEGHAANATNAPGDVLLFHELAHAERITQGKFDKSPRSDGYRNEEEKYAIDREQPYRDEIKHKRRPPSHEVV